MSDKFPKKEDLRPATAIEVLRKPDGPRLPVRYTKALHDSIVQNVARGQPPRSAAIAAGLPSHEWDSWQRAAKAGIAHPLVAQMFDDVEHARHVEMLNLLEQIKQDPSKDDLKWILEKLYAEFERKEIKIQIEQQMSAALDRLHMAMLAGRFSPEVYMDVLAVLNADN